MHKQEFALNELGQLATDMTEMVKSEMQHWQEVRKKRGGEGVKIMKALGQATLLKRCEGLDTVDLYSLFFMLLGAMTETDAWPTFYMVLNELLPTWEEQTRVRRLGSRTF